VLGWGTLRVLTARALAFEDCHAPTRRIFKITRKRLQQLFLRLVTKGLTVTPGVRSETHTTNVTRWIVRHPGYRPVRGWLVCLSVFSSPFGRGYRAVEWPDVTPSVGRYRLPGISSLGADRTSLAIDLHVG
jgi:hypothetical protein